MAREFRARGAHAQLGPMLNIMRSPEAGRNWEGPGADPFLSSVFAAEVVKGIQSQGVMATAKHFIANEQETFRMDGSSNLDMRTLMEVYMPPFEAAGRAGVASIMCSYNRVNQVYACANNHTVNGILKGPLLNFKGFVMTDWGARYSLLVSDLVMPALMPSVDGITPQDLTDERLDDMVTRIYSAYYLLNQDKDFPPLSFDIRDERKLNVYNFDYQFKEHAPLIRELGAASTVLLKNTRNLLPFDSHSVNPTQSFAVIGEDARRPRILNEFPDRRGNDGTLAQGWGSGTTEFPYLVSPLEAIEARTPNVVSSLDNYDLKSAKKAAAATDIAIVFGNADSGEGDGFDGHNADRNDLKLWYESDALIEAVASANKNTVVVLHTVGPVEMPWINHPNISAVLYAFLPGQESGNALVDVLFGDVNPSARLPFTIFPTHASYPAHVVTNSSAAIPQVPYTEGLYIDYRHAHRSGIAPLFPFGHGLSYTTFTYTRITVRRVAARARHSDVLVSAHVCNTGVRAGHEAVQVYVRFPAAAREPPLLLKGFVRVWVPPRGAGADSGPCVRARVRVAAHDLRVWSNDADGGAGGWVFVEGVYAFAVAASSGDVRGVRELFWG